MIYFDSYGIPAGKSVYKYIGKFDKNINFFYNNYRFQENINNSTSTSDEIIEEYTPKLFSEEQYGEEGVEAENNEAIENDTVELFDQDISEEEDFEIPAFL